MKRQDETATGEARTALDIALVCRRLPHNDNLGVAYLLGAARQADLRAELFAGVTSRAAHAILGMRGCGLPGRSAPPAAAWLALSALGWAGVRRRERRRAKSAGSPP